MRLEPIREHFRMALPDGGASALRAVEVYAQRYGKVLERSDERIVLRLGSAFLFRLLGTFYDAGRRSVPVRVTVSVGSRPAPDDRAVLTMESQERGYFFRAPWLVAAYSDRFREVYADLERAVRHQDPLAEE